MPEQQRGGEEDEDQVDAAGGMDADGVVQVVAAAQEPVGLRGEQPRQLGRVAAQQSRLGGRTVGAGVRDTLVEIADVVDVVADDGGGVSLLPDRFEDDRQLRVGAERVEDEVARFAVGLDRAPDDLEPCATFATGGAGCVLGAGPDRERSARRRVGCVRQSSGAGRGARSRDRVSVSVWKSSVASRRTASGERCGVQTQTRSGTLLPASCAAALSRRAGVGTAMSSSGCSSARIERGSAFW
jgi:hypothetical protein